MRKARCVVDVETFSRVFCTYIYTHTEVPRHICDVHHCETFRQRRLCFYWMYEAEIIPVLSSLTGAIISVVLH